MMSGDTPLPILRPDLDIIPGPKAHDGSPTTVVYDPLARSYNRFSWFEFAVIRLLGQPRTLDEVVDLLKQETTMDPTAEEILSVCQELVREGLTINTLIQQPDQLEKEVKARTPHWFKWLLHHYLYFRIPLLRPDSFLRKTINYVRPLASNAAFTLYFICGIMGLILVSMRHEQFFHTFQYFFNFKGLLYYGTAITFVKIVHEFSHAYTAKAHGLRVPVMGVAFIVLWPVAYCDVTDAWRIPKQRKRLPVAAAGIIAELVIAGFCLVGWAFTQPGLLNSLFFVVSTASLISTLLVNLNPAMSFDGYYIFMDVSGIDNLRSRAFNYLRYLFRTFCLGMSLTAPEKPIGWRKFLYVTYSIYSWAYRFFLYIGIAVLVYYKFTKLLGIFLFLVEVWWFIALPIVKEITSVIKMRKMLTFNARLVTSLLLLVSLAAWLVWPRSHTYYFPAVVEARNMQQIYAPFSGVVTEIKGSRGKKVRAGDEILSIASVPLRAEISELSLQEKILDKEAQLLFIQHNFSAIPEKEEEKHQVASRLQGIKKRQEFYNISAQVSGVITEWDRNLKAGQHVRQNQVFGRIVNPEDFYFAAYIPEDKVDLLSEEGTVLFYPETGAEAVSGTIIKIGKSKTDSTRHIALTSLASGDIPATRDSYGNISLLEARYVVEISPDSPMGLPLGKSGKMRMQMVPRSYLIDMWHKVYRTLVRESNF
ncbi:HlyD family efflux transporter periplasmic adaptor subunit [Maridesulfovibrio salexigens]|uniref:Peptidase M50 n=1 Tax=Maridesulfovibrio salexigens (strain ATCC 14822 / DSM 2638 / NCIMB 8403 / VKM B-1763) TaxID=526222 RepID=C6BT37_MARSD|nr:HlyD family efflux transporter periplasmic adaptor subunit [Maridesulfovibrio salexigens]ACS79741.1 peptidase M50 [Maridesulfovibrio salexigens DSM 2638]